MMQTAIPTYMQPSMATPTGQHMQISPTISEMQVSPTTSVTAPMKMTNHAVMIHNFAFVTETLTVKAGDKVTWTNQDAVAHSATADNGTFDTGVLQNEQSGSVTFTKVGVYTYHCVVHSSMHGTIIVE